MRAKILLLPGSDNDALPRAIPMLGKKLSPRLPSIARVRPVLSLIAATISGLYLLGSKVAATMAMTSTISATMPPAASSRILKTFMPASVSYSLATPNGTCPAMTWRLADSTWPRWSSKKMSAPKAFRNGPLSSPPRNKASSMRMFHARSVRTTRSWNIRIDEALFLGGLDKGPFLKAFGADIFFDDQRGHAESASRHVATGHVPFGVANE